MRLTVHVFACAILAAQQAVAPTTGASIEGAPSGFTLSVDGAPPKPTSARFLAWSPDGTRILLHDGPGGTLSFYRLRQRDVLPVASSASNPRWSPAGARIAFDEPGRGLHVFDATIPSEPPRRIAADAAPGAFAWSPDGRRIVYASAGGLTIVGSGGEGARRVVRDRQATAAAWSPDGRRIAFVERPLGAVPGAVFVARATGAEATKAGSIRATSLSFSPNGRWLLAGGPDGWIALEIATRKTVPLAVTPVSTPVWIGGQKLLWWDAKAAWAVALSDPAHPAARSIPPDTVAWAPFPEMEVTTDMLQANPFAGARPPARGHVRVEGWVDEAEPLDGQFAVLVTAQIDPSGRETHFARPRRQMVRSIAGAEFTDGSRRRPLRSIDLRLDAEVSLEIDLPSLDETSTAGIVEARVEGLPVDSVRPAQAGPRLTGGGAIDPDGVSHERVVVPLVFPVVGQSSWSDTFLAPRDGGRRRHHGQDIMAAKMAPMVACFDGIVFLGLARDGGHHTLTLRGDNGWLANYYHVNNDTPGTDDGMGGAEFAFAPGLRSGDRVYAGQLVGYVGDSGNAENTPPHLHFELWEQASNVVVNAAPSLRAASRFDSPLARVQGPEIELNAGEARFDGIVRQIDPVRRVVRAQLLAKTQNGKTRSAAPATSIWAKLPDGGDYHVLGQDNVPVAFEDLREGLYVSLVGSPPVSGKAMQPRRAAFAAP